MPRMMVDLPDDLAERVRRGKTELGLSGRASASKVLAFLIARGLRTVDEERREAERAAVYATWADDPDALSEAERNVAWMRDEGRL